MLNKVILLTGATGFLGSNIAKELVAQKAKLIILVRTKSSFSRIASIKDFTEIINIDEVPISGIFNNYKIDLVINAAASYGKKGETIEEIINANYLFPLSLLMSSIESGVEEFINIGTSLSPFVNEYSLTKNQFVEWLSFYKHKIKIKNVVLEYFYGPGDDSWKFVTMLFENFKSNAPYIDFTTGDQTRNFIFIKDVIDVFFKIIDFNSKLNSVNYFHVKSNEKIAIKELVYLCKKISKNSSTKLNFGVVNNRVNEMKDEFNNVVEYINLPNWSPKISLKEGLEKTWEYINEKNN